MTDLVKDSSDLAFMADVIEASKETPVVVDFWAPWCGPCKQLMPALERQVKAVGGKVKLVKINIDENPGVAGQLGVRSIPAVFAFKDGEPVDGFMGAQPESELSKFIARLSGDVDPKEEAETLVLRARDSLTAGDPGGAAQDFAQALQLDPESGSALAGLARVYLDMGNREMATEMVQNATGALSEHPEVASIRSELALGESAPEPDAPAQDDTELRDAEASVAADETNLNARLVFAKALAARGRRAEAVDHLIYSIGRNRMHDDEAARHFLLTIFEAEGPESEVSIDGRRRLSSILFA
ncbi:thioredoxin [Algimonas ampicilliniresistens]|uniref:Thioredoxin n=1 Tax=Algimonas ampicilliniresistens TaxID=1298735 RepID=A0ABQ5V9X4_9PROT|nr:thioredoxin [Algimonas ampicilliniresistens]GLQ23807.1 thioredoxin [Algimonas ampicilliniresistens]